ncbi:hypothetical protein [Polyangium jinanense]|uniref:Hpr(Ser) kinase/phosphatase n=1 Tax=Polyangium jinanense TaxID=2829994 RepID=A0A9X4AU92_9BACT|nr:hypothetical protein [Polyangium jinanense]MDC3957515.1 hypothetical protein [Polyangium jinanense]MDC3984994.1 hypothetical protein [Polyangium jinanense]
MRTAALHGATLAWTTEDGAPDLVHELGLDEGIGRADGRGRIEIVLRRGGASLDADPAAEGYRPSFFHGIVQAYREPAGAPRAFLLWDRKSRILVPEGASRIEAFLSGEEIVPGSARASLEIALSLALRAVGLFHLHAAALVHRTHGEAVLVVGGAGAGKTTTTITLASAGYGFLGDDALLLEDDPRGPRLCAVPRPFHVGPAALSAFPRLAPLAGPTKSHGDKRDLDPKRAFPGQDRPTCLAPTLVLHPQIEPDQPTQLAPLAKAEALGNLIASSGGLVIDDVPGKTEHLALLARITNGARHYDLRMGRDLLADPSILAYGIDGLDY